MEQSSVTDRPMGVLSSSAVEYCCTAVGCIIAESKQQRASFVNHVSSPFRVWVAVEEDRFNGDHDGNIHTRYPVQ